MKQGNSTATRYLNVAGMGVFGAFDVTLGSIRSEVFPFSQTLYNLQYDVFVFSPVARWLWFVHYVLCFFSFCFSDTTTDGVDTDFE